MYGFETPTQENIEYVADNLRMEERIEINRTSYLRSHRDIISRAVNRSVESWSISRDGVVMGLTGVAQQHPISTEACVWLFTTEELKKYPVFFVRNTRKMLERWHHRWKLLYNFVDAEYTDSLRWAKASGFEVEDPIPFGMCDSPFHPIKHWRTEDV